jgi:hypothetical protein
MVTDGGSGPLVVFKRRMFRPFCGSLGPSLQELLATLTMDVSPILSHRIYSIGANESLKQWKVNVSISRDSKLLGLFTVKCFPGLTEAGDVCAFVETREIITLLNDLGELILLS